MIWRGPLRFSVTVDSVVAVGCDVVGFWLVDLGATVLELYCSFLGLFLFGAGCGRIDFWWSG